MYKLYIYIAVFFFSRSEIAQNDQLQCGIFYKTFKSSFSVAIGSISILLDVLERFWTLLSNYNIFMCDNAITADVLGITTDIRDTNQLIRIRLIYDTCIHVRWCRLISWRKDELILDYTRWMSSWLVIPISRVQSMQVASRNSPCAGHKRGKHIPQNGENQGYRDSTQKVSHFTTTKKKHCSVVTKFCWFKN